MVEKASDSEPGAPTGGMGRDAGDELPLLLELHRDLAAAPDPEAFHHQMGAALERLLPWTAFALLPGDPADRCVPVHGGGRLSSVYREAFLEAVCHAARGAGVQVPDLHWPSPSPAEGEPPAEDPLLVPFTGPGGQRGRLAVLPADRPPRAGGGRRLVAGLAQQAGIWWSRWRHGETRRRHDRDALLEHLPCGVLLTNEHDRVEAANERARVILKRLRGRGEALGESLGVLGLPVAALPAGTATEFSSLSDQRRYTLSWGALPGPDAHRVVMVTDVTAERGSREQVQQAEKMSVIGEMLSGVAHELNNPLASVVGFSQLLLAQSTDDGQRQRLALVAEEAQRARKIVANLLDVARTRPPETNHVPLADVVESVLALFAYAFRVDDIQAEWRPAADLPAVMGDRTRLQQILVNLISNAHHALRRAPKPRRLLLSADQMEGRVRLEVRDNGTGIPAAHLERIFAPFFTTKEAGVGTGLGLSICARIAKEHGGSIHATSRPGEGATFIVDLPAAVQVASAREVKVASPAPGQGPRRILIVEDEDAFRGLLQEALEEEGREIVAVGDGQEALEALAAGASFDAVISDMRMPRLNGMELHERVKERWPDLAGKFVFITGDVMDADVRAYLEGCGVPYLPKPFGLDELAAALATVTDSPEAVPGAVVDSQAE